MIQKIKISILSIFALFMFSVPLVATSGTAMAAVTVQDCLAQGSNLDLATGGCTNKDTSGAGTSLTEFIAKVLNILSVVVGAVAVIMVIVGGFRYTTSGGKEEGVKNAKNSILYALIGLVIVALAQIIVRFVLNKTV